MTNTTAAIETARTNIETIAFRATLPTLTCNVNRDLGQAMNCYYAAAGESVVVMEAGCSFSPVRTMSRPEARAHWAGYMARGYTRTN